MAKFTAFINDKAIKSQIFDSGIIHIGRDETNDLTIDNLAVAPVHAVVTIKEDNCVVKQVNDGFPLIINNAKCKESILQNNDVITMGKHTIVFNTIESVTSVPTNNAANKDVETLNVKLETQVKVPDANLQVLDGQHIGRILPLKKSMTRLGHSGSGVIVISRRKDGYFISILEGNANITVNKDSLGDKTQNLKNNDIVIIDDVSMQFFLEN